jgi:hypothetical protein
MLFLQQHAHEHGWPSVHSLVNRSGVRGEAAIWNNVEIAKGGRVPSRYLRGYVRK